MKDNSGIISQVSDYYSRKLCEHGTTPQGVDWNSVEGQLLRFEQLNKVICNSGKFTLNDIGCGYGAFYDFLQTKYSSFNYVGVDVAANMISAARQRYIGSVNAKFLCGVVPETAADFTVASGIFNVKLENSINDWKSYVLETIAIIDNFSTKGFAFNCLTSYSDAERMKDELFYADPCELFNHCKIHYGRNVALLHDYNLFEFTIIVRKS